MVIVSAQDFDPDDAGFVIGSTYRQRVLVALDGAPGTPSDLTERTDLKMSHVSRELKPLREEGMAELLVDEDRKKGRIYSITDHGEETLEWLRENGMLEGSA